MSERLPRTRPEITDRQREVARLVAEGRTNEQIAADLGISLAGAKYHVSELLGRLGLQRREEIAAWYRTQRRRRLGARVALTWGARGAAAAIGGVAVVALTVAAVVVVWPGAGDASEPPPAAGGPAIEPTRSADRPEAPLSTFRSPMRPVPDRGWDIVLTSDYRYGDDLLVAWQRIPPGQVPIIAAATGHVTALIVTEAPVSAPLRTADGHLILSTWRGTDASSERRLLIFDLTADLALVHDIRIPDRDEPADGGVRMALTHDQQLVLVSTHVLRDDDRGVPSTHTRTRVVDIHSGEVLEEITRVGSCLGAAGWLALPRQVVLANTTCGDERVRVEPAGHEGFDLITLNDAAALFETTDSRFGFIDLEGVAWLPSISGEFERGPTIWDVGQFEDERLSGVARTPEGEILIRIGGPTSGEDAALQYRLLLFDPDTLSVTRRLEARWGSFAARHDGRGLWMLTRGGELYSIDWDGDERKVSVLELAFPSAPELIP